MPERWRPSMGMWGGLATRGEILFATGAKPEAYSTFRRHHKLHTTAKFSRKDPCFLIVQAYKQLRPVLDANPELPYGLAVHKMRALVIEGVLAPLHLGIHPLEHVLYCNTIDVLLAEEGLSREEFNEGRNLVWLRQKILTYRHPLICSTLGT